MKRVCRLFATFPRLDFEKKRILFGDLCSLVRVDRVGEGGEGRRRRGEKGRKRRMEKKQEESGAFVCERSSKLIVLEIWKRTAANS